MTVVDDHNWEYFADSNFTDRYMNTPMIGDAWKKSLTAHFKEHGTDWGQVEDAVTAVMRLATDSSINGRRQKVHFFR